MARGAQACVVETAPRQVQMSPHQLDLIIVNSNNANGGVAGSGDSSGPMWA